MSQAFQTFLTAGRPTGGLCLPVLLRRYAAFLELVYGPVLSFLIVDDEVLEGLDATAEKGKLFGHDGFFFAHGFGGPFSYSIPLSFFLSLWAQGHWCRVLSLLHGLSSTEDLFIILCTLDRGVRD